jgi:hypothetical protein
MLPRLLLPGAAWKKGENLALHSFGLREEEDRIQRKKRIKNSVAKWIKNAFQDNIRVR